MSATEQTTDTILILDPLSEGDDNSCGYYLTEADAERMNGHLVACGQALGYERVELVPEAMQDEWLTIHGQPDFTRLNEDERYHLYLAAWAEMPFPDMPEYAAEAFGLFKPQPLTRGEFTDQIREANGHLHGTAEGHVIDEERAWAAYEADPDSFHVKPYDDNETGDPIAEFVLRDGPWWVKAK